MDAMARIRGRVRLVTLWAALCRKGWPGCGNLALVLVVCQACATFAPRAHASPRTGGPAEDRPWQYDVRVEPNLDLAVAGDFAGPIHATLRVDDGAAAFVRDVVVREGASERPVVPGDAAWRIVCAARCRVRYRFKLRDAAATLVGPDTALESGGVVVAPPSTWLLRPDYAPAGKRYLFHVEQAAGVQFVTGVRPARSGAANTYEAEAASLSASSFAAFGPLRTSSGKTPGMLVSIAPGLPFDDATLLSWIDSEAAAISDYFRRPPSDRVVMLVVPGTSPATRGETLSGGGASVLIRVGTAVTRESLQDDWVVAHELVHVAFPSLSYDDAWFTEGLASYVEPVARARSGLTTVERMWAELVQGMPQGLPGPSDTGLRGNHEWGRVYWGGTLYFLLADVEIRKSTAGARGLDDAIRAVSVGVDTEDSRAILQVLEAGDRATGVPVLRDLYTRMAEAPGSQDLPALWASLGVEPDGKNIRFRDGAPFATIRAAITSAPAGQR